MRNLDGLVLGGMALIASCSRWSEDPASSARQASIRLERTPGGALAACDAAGACTEHPNPGGCAALEVTIDTATGAACSRCLDANGAETSAGCDGTVVACTVVTAPDPDCIVCAYVDGAVVYSTCLSQARACLVSSDCPDGEVCVMPPCPLPPPCGPGETCPYPECAGTCEPPGTPPEPPACDGMPPVCGTTADCPGPGDTCCSGECLPPEAGIPVSCDVIACPEDRHVGRDASCAPTCVPDSPGCMGTAECPQGQICSTAFGVCKLPPGCSLDPAVVCAAVCWGDCMPQP